MANIQEVVLVRDAIKQEIKKAEFKLSQEKKLLKDTTRENYWIAVATHAHYCGEIEGRINGLKQALKEIETMFAFELKEVGA